MRIALRLCCFLPSSPVAPRPPSTPGLEGSCLKPAAGFSSSAIRRAAQVSSEKTLAFREAFLFSTHLLLLSVGSALSPGARSGGRLFQKTCQRGSTRLQRELLWGALRSEAATVSRHTGLLLCAEFSEEACRGCLLLLQTPGSLRRLCYLLSNASPLAPRIRRRQNFLPTGRVRLFLRRTARWESRVRL